MTVIVSSNSDRQFPRAYGWRSVAAILFVAMLLGITGARLDMAGMVTRTAGAVGAALGIAPASPVAEGLGRLASQMVPIRLSEAHDVSQIADFDPANLPPLAYVEIREQTVTTVDPETMQRVRTLERTRWLVQPFGYLGHVAIKILETLEIALWGAVVAVLLGLPLALAGAGNLNQHRPIRAAARGLVAVLRALPELVSALFLVVAYGFGPIAGVLALGLHGAGFLGKFYADEMENADRAPQQAMIGMGMSRSLVWRFAVLPQVMPQFVAYTLYILDRNVRMATVVGLVGAGGIGQELKGRFDLYEYDRVATILLGILVVVVLLDRLASSTRRYWLD